MTRIATSNTRAKHKAFAAAHLVERPASERHAHIIEPTEAVHATKPAKDAAQ